MRPFLARATKIFNACPSMRNFLSLHCLHDGQMQLTGIEGGISEGNALFSKSTLILCIPTALKRWKVKLIQRGRD